MKLGFLITARLKSSRLRLKIMLPLNGYTVIERIIHRAKKVVECQDIVLCTSTNHQDLPLLRTAKAEGIYYFTGHSDDVLKRLTDAATLFQFDFIIGITADNPLFSIYHANLLSDLVRQNHGLDFIYTSGMPIGVNIYAVNVKALTTVCAVKQHVDTEIWGYLINRPEIFNILEIKASSEYIRKHYRMTLDETDDYRFFKALYHKFSKDDVVDVLDAYEILDTHPEIPKLNSHVKQLDLDEKVKIMIDSYYKENKEKILDIKNRIYLSEKEIDRI